MTQRARWARGSSSMVLVRLGLALGLFVSVACSRSGLLSEDMGSGEPELTGGSRGLPDAGAGVSGTGFSGTAGVSSGGVSTGGAVTGGAVTGGAVTGGVGGRGGFSGAGLVGGAGQGGSAASAGSAGQAGSPTMIDRGVVATWAEDRWVVATPTDDSRALVLYEVSGAGALLSGPRGVALDEPSVALTLADAARDPSTGNIGIVADSAFVTVSKRLDYVTMAVTVGPSDCFVRRIEHLQDLFVFVSVRATLEGPITWLETPGVIDGNPGFYQKELTWIRVGGCRPLAFSPWANPNGRVGVDLIYPEQNLQGMYLAASRLYDRNDLAVGSAALLPAPQAPDFNEPSRLDFARSGTRSVASFRDMFENGTRYLLVDEFGFTVLDEVVQHIPLRLAAPMKGDDQGFLQAVVAEASPPRLELRELWTGDVSYSARILANADIVAVHLARGSEGAFAVAFRVAASTPPISSPGVLSPALYLFGVTRDAELFRTELPDL